MATTTWPTRPCVVKIFEPLSTQPPASRTARVSRLPASLPAEASVRPQAPICSPRASGTRYRSFWASVPNMKTCAVQRPLWAATVKATDGSTRASSSMQMQYSTADMPAPP